MSKSRLLASLGLVLFIFLCPSMEKAQADAARDPASYISELGKQVFELLSDTKHPERERERRFRELAGRTFDVPKMARFILGRYWVAASEAERQQFISAFEDYMVQVYWTRFNQYRAEGFTVLSQHDIDADNVRVTMQIIRPTGQAPAKLDWTITTRDNTYKVSDVSIEGISQLITYREEFSSIISRNGGAISALTEELRRKAGG